MINNNILLITDVDEIAEKVTEKLVLLRDTDKISVRNIKEAKKNLEKSDFFLVLLPEITNDTDATVKQIVKIKELSPKAEILLLLNNPNPELAIRGYDAGISDVVLLESDASEFLIKAVNCFKLFELKEQLNRSEKFLYNLGVIDEKTNLYKDKSLKEIFTDFSEDASIQHGIFILLTLDERIKTRISANRLAIAIKNSTRKLDIVATSKGGKFYLILPNTSIEGAKSVIAKIQERMGENFPIRAGLTKIGLKSFEELDKIVQASLLSAVQNDEMIAAITDNLNDNPWLEDEEFKQPNKTYKLFKSAFENKMNSVIAPTFFRFQKEYEVKLPNSMVSQYTNDIECVFCLKNEKMHSELVLRYDGFAKFRIEIVHSGLNSAENSNLIIPINKLTEKELGKLLKKLKEEYIQTEF